MLTLTGCLAPLAPLWLFQAASTLILFHIYCKILKAREDAEIVDGVDLHITRVLRERRFPRYGAEWIKLVKTPINCPSRFHKH